MLANNGLDRELLVLGGVVVIGMILAILDATIVNVAIPTLGDDFHASISTIQWVMTGYLLAFASVIPLTGWASERFGAKRVWIASLLLFLAGSALAGAAWSIDTLIVFRVIQGFGAGLIMPVGQTILAQAAGPQRIGRVMSVIGVPMLLGPIFGPVIGGAIVDQVSWRWIFFVNMPVGLAALLLAWRLLPEYSPRLGQRLDLRGLALLSPGLAIFVYGMSEAGAAGGFGGRALAGIALGLALVTVFVWYAWRRGRAALIDVSLFARRGFAAAAGTNLSSGSRCSAD
jgi:EmrB/QacA subfamily drug resistance transporter